MEGLERRIDPEDAITALASENLCSWTGKRCAHSTILFSPYEIVSYLATTNPVSLFRQYVAIAMDIDAISAQ
jgi:hypothetical protein